MSDLILSGLIALLMGAVGILSYNLGKRTERNAEYDRKTDALRTANAARASLRDPAVAERLRDKYKR